jgi:hypothetical protein
MTNTFVPDAELAIAPGCVHCPVVLAGFAELIKSGKIGRLEVVNIARHPEFAKSRAIRGVPWLRLGPFELSGAYSQSELAELASRAGSETGMMHYLRDSLDSGELDQVIAVCRRSPEMLAPLLALAGDLETPFAVRIGVAAVLEDLATDGLLSDLVGDIADLAASPHAQVRADAAHFLGLTGSGQARDALARLTLDEDEQVREIALESLAELDAGST